METKEHAGAQGRAHRFAAALVEDGGMPAGQGARSWWAKWDALFLAAATLVAAVFRWYKLGSIPPGFYHDEAINGLAGLDILSGHFFMLYGFDAREPLFHWFIAAGQLIWGPTIVPVRAAAAFFGTITVPVLYLFAARFFNRWVAIVAAFGMAVSFWHVELSRFGVRGVTLPLLVLVTSYFLWQGIEAGGRRRLPFVLAGLSLGVTGYTYIAARAVPLLLIAFLLWQLFFDRATLRAVWRYYLLTVVVAAVVYAPMGYTLLSDWALFSARSGTVSLLGLADAPRAIAESALRTLGMFVVAGDTNLRQNVSGRPVFEPLGAAVFLLGLATALKNWRRPPYVFCLIWLLAMLLPGMLSDSSPHFIRTLGAAPAAYILAGIGVAALGGALRARVSPRWYALGVALWLAGSVFFGFRSYFQEWAGNPAVAQAFENQLSEPARYLASAPPGPAVVFLPVGYPSDYPQVFQYLGRRAIEQVRWFDGNSTMMLPSDLGQEMAAGTVFLVLGSNPDGEELLRTLPGMKLLEHGDDARGAPLFTAYQATEPVWLGKGPDMRQLGVVIGDQVLLEGYRLVGDGAPQRSNAPWQAEALPGGKLTVQIAWRVLRPASRPDLRLSFQLIDPKGRRLTGVDRTGYDSKDWRGGERLITDVDLTVPPDAPPGKYELRAGAYSYADQARLPVADSAGNALGDSAALLALKVLPSAPATPPTHPVEASLENGPKLLGYDWQVVQGEARVVLYWQATGVIPKDYSVFVHLSDATGHPIAQHDSVPSGGLFPTSYWAPGEIIRDEHVIPLSAQDKGQFALQVGMYQLSSGRRLLNPAGGDYIALGEVTLP